MVSPGRGRCTRATGRRQLHHLPVVERAPEPADAQRACATRRCVSAAAGIDVLQHPDRAGRQAGAVARRALQDDARVHRARRASSAGPDVPADQLPAHREGRGRDHHQLREPARRGRPATSTWTRRSCTSSPRPSTTTCSARATGTRRWADGCGHGVDRPFVLFVSSLWPYKNCDGLLRAFAAGQARAGGTPAGRWSGPGATSSTSAELRALADELGIATTSCGSAGYRSRTTVALLPVGGRLRLPVAQRDVRPADPRGHGLRLPRRDVERQLDARDRGRGGPARRPGTTPSRSATAIVAACGAGGRATAARRVRAGRQFNWATTAEQTLEVYREVYARGTGGSHGEDPRHRRRRLHRLAHLRPAVALGHDVVVLDALTAPVHRDGNPTTWRPGPSSSSVTSATATCVANLLRRVDAVYHFAAYQDYLPDFARVHRRQRRRRPRCSTRSPWPRASTSHGSSWPRRSRRWARGSTAARARRADRRICARSRALARAQWDLAAPSAAARSRCCARLSASRTRRTPTGCPSTARRWWRSTSAAATRSRPWRCATASCRGRGSRSTTPTRARAASSACTTCSAARPTLYEDGRPVRDYVNIHDVVDANELVLDRRPAPWAGCSTSAAARRTPPREFAEIVRGHYGSDLRGRVSGEYRFGDTRHILSDIDALTRAGLVAAAHAGGLRGRVRRVAQAAGRASTRCSPTPTRRCGRSAWCARAGVSA